jgi:hypothetical protein
LALDPERKVERTRASRRTAATVSCSGVTAMSLSILGAVLLRRVRWAEERDRRSFDVEVTRWAALPPTTTRQPDHRSHRAPDHSPIRTDGIHGVLGGGARTPIRLFPRTIPTMSTDPHFSSAVFAPPAPVVERGPIHAGARWEGTQRSGRVTYEVKVTLETFVFISPVQLVILTPCLTYSVDLVAGTVCGLLEINGLTPDLDSLETYFTGDIIGCQSPSGPGFTTGRWGATLDDDRCHWSRFPAFRAIKNGLTGPGQTYNVSTSSCRALDGVS